MPLRTQRWGIDKMATLDELRQRKQMRPSLLSRSVDRVEQLIYEYGSVKTKAMIQSLYDNGQLSQGHANIMILVCISHYRGDNIEQFDLK